MEPQKDEQQNQPEVASAPEQAMASTPAPQPVMMPTAVAPASSASVNPGHGMGIVGLVLAFLAPLIGLILSIVAMSKSKKAGMGNGLALAGIIIGSINTVLGTLFLIGSIAGIGSVVQKCNDLGPGTHYEDGTTITCG